MMSGADFDAMLEQRRSSKRKAAVAAMLGRCEQSHPDKITPERFHDVCDALFHHETLGKFVVAYSIQEIDRAVVKGEMTILDALHIPKFVVAYSIQEIDRAVVKGEMTILDALHKCFLDFPGSREHLYFIISKLFELERKSIEEGNALLDQMILTFNTRDRLKKGQAFYVEAFKNATSEKFDSAICQILKTNVSLRPIGLPTLREGVNQHIIDVLDALSECLTLSDEYMSFKFLLVSRLFDLKKEEDQETKAIVDGFAEAVKQATKPKKYYLDEIIHRIERMTQQEFHAVCEDTDVARSYFNGKETKRIITPRSGMEGVGWIIPIFPSYLIVKGVKSAIRSISSSALESKITRERLSVFDAVYELLSQSVGQDSSHSFKFCFILAICGFTFKDKGYIVPDTALGKYLNKLRWRENQVKLGGTTGSFNSEKYEEPSQLVQALIQAMRAVKESAHTSMYNAIEIYVQQCYAGEVKIKTFVDALKAVRAVRDKELEDAGSTFLGSLSTFAKTAKTASRNNDFDDVIAKLEKQEITVLYALNSILNGTGEKGPHSMKYALLKKLFKDLNKDIVVTAVESGATIGYFIQAINEIKKSSLQEIPLEEKPRTDISL